MLDAYEYQPIPDWPAGCYRARLAISRLFLVVVRELPATRETLLLRLMGRGPTFQNAVDELAALPSDAWEKQLVSPLLIALAFEIPKNPETDMEAREYLRETRALYAEWEQRVRRESREDGERTLLRKQLVRRFGELPADILARLDEATSEQLERWGERVLTAETLADVFSD